MIEPRHHLDRAGAVSPRAAFGGAATAVIGLTMALGITLGVNAVVTLGKGGRNGLFGLLAVIAIVLGGFRAGLLAPPAPLTNAAAAGVIATIPLHVVRIVQRVRAHESIPVGTLVFATLLAASAAVFGGFVANAANRQRRG